LTADWLWQGLAGRLAFDGSSEPVARSADRLRTSYNSSVSHHGFRRKLAKVTLAEMDHRCLLQKGYRPRRFFPNRPAAVAKIYQNLPIKSKPNL
jgi:hypothetical protein